MLRRTLASVFLLILLLAQVIPGVCRAQCERVSPKVSSSCHNMSMDTGTDRLEVPCTTHSCTSDIAIVAQRHSVQQNLSSRPAELAAKSGLVSLSAVASPPQAAFTPGLRHNPAQRSPATTLKTALRV